MIKLKRAYDSSDEEDGLRILVDRLWPRGLSKEKAKIDVWLKDVAPTNELRKWFKHDPHKWDEFKRRYFKELDHKPDSVKSLLNEIEKGLENKEAVTLVYAAKDEEHNNAVALKEYIRDKLDKL